MAKLISFVLGKIVNFIVQRIRTTSHFHYKIMVCAVLINDSDAKWMKNDISNGVSCYYSPQRNHIRCDDIRFAKCTGKNHANYATYILNSLKSCYFVENWLLCECFYCRHYRNVLWRGCTDTKLAVVFCISMCCTTMKGFIARAFVARSLKTVKCSK